MAKRVLLKLLGITYILCWIGALYADAQPVRTLKKTDELLNTRFNNIEDVCCDGNGYLYVVDSGTNKIHICRLNGGLIKTFGGAGQGHGEFLAQPNKAFLRISAGNDGNLYITDTGNKRLSVFSGDGVFLKDYIISHPMLDRPQVNSKGDIYMLLDGGDTLIGRYDRDIRLTNRLLKKKAHYDFRYGKPDKYLITINDLWLKKLITSTDNIILISNASLSVHIFTSSDELANKFIISNTIFLQDYKKRIKAARSNHQYVLPFNAALDKYSNIIYLSYFNESLDNFELYRYRTNGTLIDILRFSDKITYIFCVEKSRLFIVTNKSTISIFDL